MTIPVMIKYILYFEQVEYSFMDSIDIKYQALINERYNINFKIDADNLYDDLIDTIHSLMEMKGVRDYMITEVWVDMIDIINRWVR